MNTLQNLPSMDARFEVECRAFALLNQVSAYAQQANVSLKRRGRGSRAMHKTSTIGHSARGLGPWPSQDTQRLKTVATLVEFLAIEI
jgi:hypothetical protein